MRKTIILMTLIISMTLTTVIAFAGQVSSPIIIDGELVNFSSTTGYPFVDENSRTQVPFRVTLEAFGAKVNWEQSTKTAIAEKNGIMVEVPIGEKYIVVNGAKVENDTAALVVEGKTYLPIRKVIESFGAIVDWNPKKNSVEITTIKDKNIYTAEYLESLVASTECDAKIEEFREKNNSRRNGLLKEEGKYFDMYYPNDEYGKQVARFLAPHMDKVYMMLTDIFGLQATVEVHLIHERDALSLKEGNIRAKERITYIWLEPNNDDGGNNLSEFIHEISHNFFDEANGGATNTMWLNESNAYLVPSLYIKHNYVGDVDMWSFYEMDSMAWEINRLEKDMILDRANQILREAKAWSKASGEKRAAQVYGRYIWAYIYNNYDLEEYKHFLTNLGTGDVVKKLEELLDMSSKELSETIRKDIDMKTSSN